MIVSEYHTFLLDLYCYEIYKYVIMNNIPLRIKAMMKEYKWSAPKLSERSGVPLPSLKSILHGQSKNPRKTTINALANAFNCEVSEFELAPDAPVEVRKRVSIEDVPVLEKAHEEELVKTAIFIIDEIAVKKGFELAGRDDLREAYVGKLMEFALENSRPGEQPKIDRVYASWLVGQELV